MPSLTKDRDVTYEAIVFPDGRVFWNEPDVRIIRVTKEEMQRFDNLEINTAQLLELDHIKDDILRCEPDQNKDYLTFTIDDAIEEFDQHFPPRVLNFSPKWQSDFFDG